MKREYTVADTETGNEITFEWEAEGDPTDTDMEQVFAAAREGTSEGETSLQRAGNLITDIFKRGPGPVAKEAFAKNPEPVLKALPAAGGMAGLFMTGNPAGAALGGMIGKSAEQISRVGMGLPRAAQGTEQILGDIGRAGLGQGAAAVSGEAIGPAIGLAGKVLGPFGKGAAKVGQMVTGVEAQKFRRLAQDPAAILPEFLGGSKSVAKAGRELGAAIDETNLIKETNPFFNADSVSKNLWDKTKSFLKGETPPPTPQEMFEGKRAIDEVLSKTPWAKRQGTLWRDRVLFKNYLRDELGKLYGNMAKASKDYARSALGRDFLSVVPVNQSGTPSILRSGIGTGLATAAGLPFAAGLAASSPLVAGGLTAAGSGLIKGAVGAAKNPVLRRGFLSILADSKTRRTPESAPAKAPSRRAAPHEFDTVHDAGNFIEKSAPGTRFKIGGKTYKVIENTGRKKEDLQKLPKFLQEAYYRSKANAKGRNTFTLA